MAISRHFNPVMKARPGDRFRWLAVALWASAIVVLIPSPAESQNVVQSAQEKLRKKKLDLIVANDISAPGIGFQSDSNQVTLIDKEGKIDSLPRLSKREIADVLLDRIKGRVEPGE